ncbi:MAG: hypothetical protein CVU55_06315 [Deltaproteobacteria bacterium HGW-Deltaproteobacteria-13]|jgi:hypothetical protein|nr:MAG: hypothetical protein CVU55_06315 [Deltaproteobacteria bacterium HGW-Deltaproteobacteria-13]
MSLWKKLFGDEKQGSSKDKLVDTSVQHVISEPGFYNEEIPGTLDLGWYYSKNKNEFQMAKINQKDRATHLYVIGASGTGKTKFLEYLILQDIEKGNGFGVIDPHGDLIEDIKGIFSLHYSYDDEDISKKIVLIDPTDKTFTVTFNPLEKLPGVSISEQVNELVGSFRRIWAEAWGVRMEDLMRNSLIALGEAELSLAELPAFLTGRSFRKNVLDKVEHPLTRDYFARFDMMTDRTQITWIEPVMNKINAFLAEERIRQMFSSTKSTFHMREIMDNRKMLLVRLDKGKLKDSADLLGSLLMAKIQIAAFSRSDIPQSKRVPFYMYIDEFQNFATESFAVILSEARKYGLSLIMAHQTLAQISAELRSLILGNTGMQVCFRVNRQDAQLLAKETFRYSGEGAKIYPGGEWEHYTEELQDLAPRCCYAKHKIEGGVIPLQTVEIEPAWEVLGMEEDEYAHFLLSYPFGKNYLVSRKELIAHTQKRQKLSAKVVEDKPAVEKHIVEVLPMPAREKPERSEAKKPIPAHLEESGVIMPDTPQKGKSQHRYLQTLIKRMAENKGFRVVLEKSVADGAGRVDVSLERDGRKIACEISVTTSDNHELGNIEKCLAAGYDMVIMCSTEKKFLEKVKSLASQRIKAVNQEKVLFLQPDDLFFYLEKEAASMSGKEERVKGYRVKVQYQPVAETEKNTRREAVGQVILQALRRMKEEK